MLDVQAAIDALIKGSAPGVNPSFLPPAAALGAECRRQAIMRAEAERRLSPKLPPPTAPDVTPEERERVAEKIKALVIEKSETIQEATDEELAKRKAFFAKVNEYFEPDMSEAAVLKRLGFTVGDKEDHEAAA